MKKNERACTACGETLRDDETHWSIFPAPMGGYVCPRLLDLIEFTIQKERARITEAAGTAVSHLAFECKNSRVRQGVQMGANVVLAIVNNKEATG